MFFCFCFVLWLVMISSLWILKKWMWNIVHQYPWFRNPGNGPTLLHHTIPMLPAGKKDAKLYIAKGSLNVDNTNDSRQDGPQDTLFCSLSFTVVEKQPWRLLCVLVRTGELMKKGISFWDFPLHGVSLWMVGVLGDFWFNTLTISLWSNFTFPILLVLL